MVIGSRENPRRWAEAMAIYERYGVGWPTFVLTNVEKCGASGDEGGVARWRELINLLAAVEDPGSIH